MSVPPTKRRLATVPHSIGSLTSPTTVSNPTECRPLELPSCLPTKQKQRHSDDEFMLYSLSSEQNWVSESASNSDDDSCNSDDDCLILDGDPDKSNAIMLNNFNGSDDLVIISEKGQAKFLRDFEFLIRSWEVGFADDDSCNSDDDCLIRDFEFLIRSWEVGFADDDCLILDGDPDKPNAIILNNCNGSDDLVIISEKGQARFLRDFEFLIRSGEVGFARIQRFMLFRSCNGG